jgi:hypothetical protein
MPDRRLALLLAACVIPNLIDATLGRAQTIGDPDREVIIRVTPGEVILPTRAVEVAVSQAQFRSTTFRVTLEAFGVDRIRAAHPSYVPNDTLFITHDNRLIHLTDLTLTSSFASQQPSQGTL